MRHRSMCAAAVLIAGVLLSREASAFCGFYVSGAGADLFNNATQVALMRHGTRTVLSMRNDYQGPPKDFALVVPVPVVLQEENVKTLPESIFGRLDKLAAPRLVEYWEKDPCWQPRPVEYESGSHPVERSEGGGAGDLGVKVEAEFEVGEYEIVILSAKESTGLDTWLRKEDYEIPEGAEPYLRPYVEGGSKFFVAKVNVEKVKFEDGRAMLSPLRFHYDSEEFELPIRLGMMNSQGTQDLIVHVLAPGQRYEVANYENATIPTNLNVAEDAKERFGQFYAALFDRTLEKNPGAVITEYAWNARSCDPCPEPALNRSELATLGADVLGQGDARNFVLTRLHARYEKDGIKEDLVFKAAEPIVGGRERRGPDGELEQSARPGSVNNFQARYAIRHPWEGEIDCEDPKRGRWGGPPKGGEPAPTPATDLAFVPRGKVKLAEVVRQDVPEIELEAEQAAGEKEGGEGEGGGEAKDDAEEKKKAKKEKGCAAGGGATGGGLALLFAALLALRRRRR